MKKLLSILAAIGMASTTAVSVVSCGEINTGPIKHYPEQSGKTYLTKAQTEADSVPVDKISVEALQTRYAVMNGNEVDTSKKIIISNVKTTDNNMIKESKKLTNFEANSSVKISFDLQIQITLTAEKQNSQEVQIGVNNGNGFEPNPKMNIEIPELPKANDATFTFVGYDEQYKQLVYKTNITNDDLKNIQWPSDSYTQIINKTLVNGKLTLTLNNDYLTTYGANDISFSYAPVDTNPINFNIQSQGQGITISKDLLNPLGSWTQSDNSKDPNGTLAHNKAVINGIWNKLVKNNEALKNELTNSLKLSDSEAENQISASSILTTQEFNDANLNSYVGAKEDSKINNNHKWWTLDNGSYYVVLTNNTNDGKNSDVIKINVVDQPNPYSNDINVDLSSVKDNFVLPMNKDSDDYKNLAKYVFDQFNENQIKYLLSQLNIKDGSQDNLVKILHLDDVMKSNSQPFKAKNTWTKDDYNKAIGNNSVDMWNWNNNDEITLILSDKQDEESSNSNAFKTFTVDIKVDGLYDQATKLSKTQSALVVNQDKITEDQNTISGLNDKVSNLLKDKDKLNKQVSDLENQIASNQGSSQKLQDQIDKLQKDVDDKQKEIDSANQQIKTLQNKLGNETTQNSDLKQQINQQKDNLDKISKQLQDTQSNLTTTKNDLETTKNDLNSTKTSLDNEQKINSQLKKDLSSSQQKVATLETDNKNLNNNLNDSNKKLDSAKSLLEQKQSEIEGLNQTISDKQSQLDDANKTISNDKSQISKDEDELNTLNAKNIDLENQLKSSKVENDSLSKALENIQQNIEDLGNQKDELQSELKNAQDSNKQDETKINNLENEIQDTNNKLKKSEIQKNELQSELRLAKTKINDLENEKIELEQNIKQLTSEKDSLQSELDSANSQISSLEDDLANAKESLNTAINVINNKQKEIDQLTDSIENMESELIKFKNDLTNAQNENADLTNKLADSTNEIDSLQSYIDKDNLQIAQLKDKQVELQDRISELNDENKELNDEISNLNYQINSLEELIKNNQQQISQLNSSNKEMQNKLADANDEIGNLKEQIENKDEIINGLNNSLNNALQSIKKLISIQKSLTSEIDNLNYEVNVLREIINNSDTTIKKLSDELNKKSFDSTAIYDGDKTIYLTGVKNITKNDLKKLTISNENGQVNEISKVKLDKNNERISIKLKNPLAFNDESNYSFKIDGIDSVANLTVMNKENILNERAKLISQDNDKWLAINTEGITGFDKTDKRVSIASNNGQQQLTTNIDKNSYNTNWGEKAADTFYISYSSLQNIVQNNFGKDLYIKVGHTIFTWTAQNPNKQIDGDNENKSGKFEWIDNNQKAQFTISNVYNVSKEDFLNGTTIRNALDNEYSLPLWDVKNMEIKIDNNVHTVTFSIDKEYFNKHKDDIEDGKVYFDFNIKRIVTSGISSDDTIVTFNKVK